jgi:hypothetical protein
MGEFAGVQCILGGAGAADGLQAVVDRIVPVQDSMMSSHSPVPAARWQS